MILKELMRVSDMDSHTSCSNLTLEIDAQSRTWIPQVQVQHLEPLDLSSISSWS